MTARNILKALSEYSRARLKFCEQVANEATAPENVAFMESNGIVDLLIPLIEDPQLNIRINSINCLGRMCNYAQRIADALIERNVPQMMLQQFVIDSNDNAFFKKVTLQALTRIAKHGCANATAVSDCGGMSAFLCCTEDPNVAVKEMAACGVGCLVSKSSMLATSAIENGAIPALLMCFQSHELQLKNISALAMGDLAVHSADHARAVVEATAVLHLARAMNNIDAKLKRNILYTLANIASHHKDLAEAVIEADVLPRAIIHMGIESVAVRKQSIRLVQEIVKHSDELAQLVVNSGGLGAIIQLMMNSLDTDEDLVTYAATTLGYIGGQSPHLALAIIECKGIKALMSVLCCDKMNCLQLCQTVWALGHIGKHTPEHSRALGESNVFCKILEFYEHQNMSEELKKKCKCTLKLCLQCCLYMPALEPLLYNASPDILKYTLGQYSKILPHDPEARRNFITTGGLKKVQEIKAEPGTHLFEYISIINSCYPEDIVRYYTPEFPSTILERVDQYKPQPISILSENVSLDGSCDEFAQKHPPSRKSSRATSIPNSKIAQQ